MKWAHKSRDMIHFIPFPLLSLLFFLYISFFRLAKKIKPSQSFRTFFRIEFQSCNQVNDVWNSVRIDIHCVNVSEMCMCVCACRYKTQQNTSYDGFKLKQSIIFCYTHTHIQCTLNCLHTKLMVTASQFLQQNENVNHWE